MEYRVFDEADYCAWAGAEPFAKGQPPLVSEGKFSGDVFTDYILVADWHGLQVLLVGKRVDGSYSEECWALYRPTSSPPAGLLLQLPDELSYELLSELGFQKL